MKNKGYIVRGLAGLLGGTLLASIGTAALAAYPDPEGSEGVDVKVEIEPTENGALSLTVAGTETTLAENGSTASFRQFTGTLPEVTVTDTRSDIAAGVAWYVVGQAGAFVGDAGQPDIAPEQLGWAPAMVGDDNGEVAAGDVVDTSFDSGQNAVGLVGEELLYFALDSAEAKAVAGQWTAAADLRLKTAVEVAPGNYTSLLTLSLFEDEY